MLAGIFPPVLIIPLFIIIRLTIPGIETRTPLVLIRSCKTFSISVARPHMVNMCMTGKEEEIGTRSRIKKYYFFAFIINECVLRIWNLMYQEKNESLNQVKNIKKLEKLSLFSRIKWFPNTKLFDSYSETLISDF